MSSIREERGFLLLEVLITVGLIGILFTSIAGLFLVATRVSEATLLKQEAQWYAQEGVDAVRTIAFEELTPTSQAQINYSPVSDRWMLQNSQDETLPNNMVRTIAVTTVERDAQCKIVASGGTVDPDSLLLTSTVSWTVRGQTRAVVQDVLRTNWQNPMGSCFKPTQSAGIRIDSSGAYWGGTKQLRGVTVYNDGIENATITHVTVNWDGPSELEQVFMIGAKVWSESGPGSPLGEQGPGVLLDVVDVTISGGSFDDTHKLQFEDASVVGSTFTIEFTFADGSVYVSDPFTP